MSEYSLSIGTSIQTYFNIINVKVCLLFLFFVSFLEICWRNLLFAKELGGGQGSSWYFKKSKNIQFKTVEILISN